jgi:hypothetical protein
MTAMGLLLVDNDREYHDRHGGNIDLTQRGQATTSITQKAGISHLSSTESHFNEASLRSTPVNVVEARRTKNARRQPPRQTGIVQPEGVQMKADSQALR